MRLTEKSIFVAGHTGLVGSAIVRRLERQGCARIITRSHSELDLTHQTEVLDFFRTERPQVVFLAAARVGGIWANSTRPAEFIRENLLIATNVIEASHSSGVEKLINLGSSCIYPRFASQPLKEEYLLTGPLEETNRAYAVAKIAAVELASAYRTQYGFDALSVMPPNLYGPGDNFDLESSHVLPALMAKLHRAKCAGSSQVVLWGTGTPRREFMHVDDLADGLCFLAQNSQHESLVNIGWGQDLTIRELAEKMAEVIGFRGDFSYDTTRPDGVPRKVLDISKLTRMGWAPKIKLNAGLVSTYAWFRKHLGELVAS